MTNDLLTTRLRTAWRQLVELNAFRAATTARIEKEHEGESAAAKRDLDQARGVATNRVEADREAAVARHRDEVAEVEREMNTRITQARRAYDQELETIQDKAEASEREARKQLEEAIWLSETVYEETEDRPRLAYDQARKTLLGRLEDLQQLHETATTLLQRCRQATPAPWREPPDDPAGDAPGGSDLEMRIAEVVRRVEQLQAMKLARLCIGVRFPLLVLVATGVAVVSCGLFGGWSLTIWMKTVPAGVLVLGGLLGVGLLLLTRSRIHPLVAELDEQLTLALDAYARAVQAAAVARDEHATRLEAQRDEELRKAREKYEPILAEIERRREQHLERIHGKYPTLIEELEAERNRQVTALNETHATRIGELDERAAHLEQNARGQADRRLSATEQAYQEQWSQLHTRWTRQSREIQTTFQRVHETRDRLFPAWTDPSWETWTPPTEFVPAIPFGALQVDMSAVEGGVSSDERLPMAWPEHFALPACLSFPDDCSLLLEHGDLGGEQAVQTLQTVMFRLLTALPPGKVRFTIIDPVGLGQNFAAFMHLADSLESLVTDRIWTETRHIEQRLMDLTDHMENVIQKYLRNEYETIAEYNEQAGEIAEPYRFLVIANFPVNMSDTATRRLASIVNSGKRCGVYTLIAMDTRQAPPKGFETDDLRRASVNLVYEDDAFRWKDEDYESLPLSVEQPPDAPFMIPRLRLVGEAAKDSSRVEVPFQVVTPDHASWWSCSAAEDLRVPLGRCGATSLQHMELGHGTSQHVLIAGKTGSGKSTLLHVLITNLALWYGPDEIELYLVDFKKGVEFKHYAAFELPHARAVAIESDREFGLSVLQRLDEELKRRGELFRTHGVQDLAGYRRGDGPGPMPRTLLIIDEFQEFFTDDDRIAQEAALLLDRLVRQGRAFGVHVILGSQTLGGAYSLAKSTMGQMAVRVALQCSESDSYMILSEDNAAARLLARPGEAIYNDASGLIEGNSPFQTVWLAERERERYLEKIRSMARQHEYRPPEPQIVFEGNVAADVTRNQPLEDLLTQPRPERPAVVMPAYLGEAIAIKDPTAAHLRRQAGHNLLIVGQRDEASVALMTVSAVGLAASAPPLPDGGDVTSSFHILDGIPADSPRAGWAERLASVLPLPTTIIDRRELEPGLAAIAAEVERRQSADAVDEPPIFVLVMGLQRFRDLRQTDSFSFSMDEEPSGPSPDKLFQTILSDGPVVGVHAIIWCDTAANVDRCLDRQTMREFDLRVVFQMSAADSTNIIDTPAANKLGLHHAIFYSEELGIAEKFRPYGIPDESWMEQAGRALAAC